MRNKKLVFVLLAVMVMALAVLGGCADTTDDDVEATPSAMAVPGTSPPDDAVTQTQPVETVLEGTMTPTVTATP